MTKRLLEIGLCVAVLTSLAPSAWAASARRETPAVLAIQRVKPSVVNIHTQKLADPEDSIFSTGRGRMINGMGTGIVIDERGYIITNYHVVLDVKPGDLHVTLSDGSTYNAETVSYDPENDLAVIKINPAKPLALMPLGTSSDLMLAETVIAIGNAFGYEDSVTLGIVSSLSRDVEVNEKQSYKNLIQTDASINPGNSGGPLVNLDGEVVGINVAIRAGAQRIGFAIPIDDAREIIARLLSVEQLSNTYHGLLTRDLKQGARRELVVTKAATNSPAEKAGFQKDDVIVKVGNTQVVDGADFERSLLELHAGDMLDVVVRRNASEQPLKLTLGDFRHPSPQIVRANNSNARKVESADDKSWKILGLRLGALDSTQVSLVAPRYSGGMRVLDVRPDSPADRDGIKTGDILVGLHIWEMTCDEDLDFLVNHPKLQSFNPLKFYILRGGETLYNHLHLANANR